MRTYAKPKLDALRRRVNELEAMNAGLRRSITERTDNRERVLGHYNRIREELPDHIHDDQYRRVPRPPNKEELALQTELEEMNENLAMLRDSQKQLSARLAPMKALLRRCEDFIKTHRLEPDYGQIDSPDHQHVA